ncbi:MAG: hypothetical protein INQ03_12125 [Candidatus Heimdallarchaeota archaeon]|nr:hypothetical protein [Candidatus Heimdallarchaeota archaeon]
MSNERITINYDWIIKTSERVSLYEIIMYFIVFIWFFQLFLVHLGADLRIYFLLLPLGIYQGYKSSRFSISRMITSVTVGYRPQGSSFVSFILIMIVLIVQGGFLYLVALILMPMLNP